MQIEKQLNLRIWHPVFDGELITIPDSVAVTKTAEDDKMFADATKIGDYLPRVQLMTSASEKCKKNEFPVNHYALIQGQNYIDLGAEADVAVIDWRPKAIEIGDEIISVFDSKDPEFERIQLKSDEKDSGCMFGPEFLIWVPTHKQFATFFMGSKSSRREAPAVKALIQKAATLKSHFIETKKFSWQSPTITVCSTPFDLPEEEDLVKNLTKFKNPPKQEVERVDAATSEGQARDR